jgi:hypothetical protein
MKIGFKTFATLAALAWQWNRQRRKDEASRRRSKAKPVEVSTWEGEGGALPVSGAQLGPPPVRR